jgi:hypothetical protein
VRLAARQYGRLLAHMDIVEPDELQRLAHARHRLEEHLKGKSIADAARRAAVVLAMIYRELRND